MVEKSTICFFKIAFTKVNKVSKIQEKSRLHGYNTDVKKTIRGKLWLV